MAQGKITHEPPEHPIVHCVPLCPRWTAQSMVITACFNSRFRYNRGNTLPWTFQKPILSLHWDTHLTQGRQLLHEKVCLLTRPEIYRSLFALSSSREKMSLRSNSCSAVHLCLQAVCWALWNDTEETRGGWGGFPPNSCTWLTTWPQAWLFHLSRPPVPRPAKPPASTRWPDGLAACFAMPCAKGHAPYTTSMPAAASLGPWSPRHEAQLVRLTQGPPQAAVAQRRREEPLGWSLGEKGEGHLTRVFCEQEPHQDTHSPHSLVTQPSVSSHAHITWRRQCLTNVCEVPDRIQLPA